MRDHAYSGRLHCQVFFHLAGGEARDGDDQVAAARGFPSLFGEPRAKLGRRVLAGDDEQIVKGGYGPAGGCVHALVQGMKDVGVGRAAQEPAGGVPRQGIAEGAQEAMRPVAEQELVLGMRARQTKQDFTRVHSYAGQIPVQAIGSVEGDTHFLA